MLYYRLYAVLSYPPYQFPHLFTRKSTELLKPPADLCPYSERISEQAYESECEIIRVRDGIDAERIFRYVMSKNDLLPCSWLSCFTVFCRSAIRGVYAFEDGPITATVSGG